MAEGTEISLEEVIQELKATSSELIALQMYDEAMACLKKALKFSERHMGDDVTFGVSTDLLYCVMAKLNVQERQVDRVKMMLEEALKLLNSTKHLARGPSQYDSVARLYTYLGDCALLKGEVDLSLKIFKAALTFVETEPVAYVLSSPVYTKHLATMNFGITLCHEQSMNHGEALKHCETSVIKSGVLLKMEETAKDMRIKLLHLRGLEKMEVLKYAADIPREDNGESRDPPQPSEAFLAKKAALEAAFPEQ